MRVRESKMIVSSVGFGVRYFLAHLTTNINASPRNAEVRKTLVSLGGFGLCCFIAQFTADHKNPALKVGNRNSKRLVYFFAAPGCVISFTILLPTKKPLNQTFVPLGGFG